MTDGGEQLDGGIAAVGNRDQSAFGQPAGDEDEELASPVGQMP